jgi:extracellular solute-binding protein (family 5)
VLLIGRGVAAFAFVVGLQAMTWACGSRTTAPAVPVPVPAPPSTVPITPEPAGSPPAPTTVPSHDDTDDCALIAAAGEPVGTVALTERVDPSNAPRPSNESERLVFRQLYETLVRVDCMGRLVPGLAASWQLDGDGRTWIATLREGARFSDGSPVTAADVRAAWTRDRNGDALQPQVNRLVQSIVAVDDRTVAIRLQSQHVDAPRALAHPDLAIARYAADSRWPIGTRVGRIGPDGDVRGSSAITLVRDDLLPLRFLIALGDPRDLLDSGVDLLLTRDQATLGYAATLPQFQSVPLAWQRTRILITPGRSPSSPALSDDARQILAGDAVRGEARGAQGPLWWALSNDCGIGLAPTRNPSSFVPRIVYDASDSAARDLAERLVGLARASGPEATAYLDVLLPDRPRRTYQRATGLTGAALAMAVRAGTDAGYIVSVVSRPLDPCRDVHVLMYGAPWVDPATIVPLVDTRLHAVVRRGRSGVTAEWDGGLVIAGGNASR